MFVAEVCPEEYERYGYAEPQGEDGEHTEEGDSAGGSVGPDENIKHEEDGEADPGEDRGGEQGAPVWAESGEVEEVSLDI